MAPATYNIDQLDNAAFEHAIADLFRRRGFYIEVNTLSGGIVAKRTDEIIVIDCKNNQRALGKSAIQILHSTISTYGAGARGLVISTSGFTADAIQHAAVLTKQAVPVELWNFQKIVEAGRSVEINFTTGASTAEEAYEPRTNAVQVVFEPRAVTDHEAGMWLWEQYLQHVRSSPRHPRQAFGIRKHADRTKIPAIIVEYDIDQSFSNPSRTTIIHRASDSGRSIFPLRGSDPSQAELNVLASATLQPIAPERVAQEQLMGLFENGIELAVERIRNRIAEKHSAMVYYKGKNKHQYHKTVSVNPNDVSTRPFPVIYDRLSFRVRCGPQTYHFVLISDGNGSPALISSVGDHLDLNAVRARNASVCNDCGSIFRNQKKYGGECVACRRTLCREHSFWLAIHPWYFKRRICGPCFLKDADRLQIPADSTVFSPGIFLGLCPGTYWIYRNRPMIAGISGGVITVALVLGILIAPKSYPWFIAGALMLGLAEAVSDWIVMNNGARARKVCAYYTRAWRDE